MQEKNPISLNLSVRKCNSEFQILYQAPGGERGEGNDVWRNSTLFLKGFRLR